MESRVRSVLRAALRCSLAGGIVGWGLCRWVSHVGIIVLDPPPVWCVARSLVDATGPFEDDIARA